MPAIAFAPSLRVNVVPDTPVTFSLNWAVTFENTGMLVALAAGVVETTIGATVSAPVVNDQVFGVSAAPWPSVMPLVKVAV